VTASASLGQETTQPESTSPRPADAPVPEKPKLLSLIPQLPDYTGDWHTRKYLTGDWGGARTDLAEKGILFDLTLNQYLQGNVHGGKDTNNAARYSGGWDLYIKLDSARLGLWPAGLLELHLESFFGDPINDESGSLSNDDALNPVPGDRDVMLSHVQYTQALSEHFGVVLGKLDPTQGDKNEFAWLHGNNFLHSSFRWNPIVARTAPYSPLGAGFFVTGDWGQWTVSVYDTEGAANRTGFDTAFEDGTSVATEARFNVKPFGLTGHQLAGVTWSDKNFVALDQDPRVALALPGRRLLRLALFGLTPEHESGSWSFYYNFDQYLCVEPQDETQGIGLFGRFGISDGEANAIETFYSIGIGGKGIIPERDNDKFGLGYYYTGYSGDLPDFLNMDYAQGVELFYRIEVTPWFHLTPDLQVIVNPGGNDDVDTAVVYGIRGEMSF
jgi:porin